MIVMPRVDSGGRVTAVVKGHYLKKQGRREAAGRACVGC